MTKNPYKSITYFKGLNTLRFIAAYLVLIHHAEQIRVKNGFEDIQWLSLFRNGDHAVTFFFVLSGFLITYLLLKENYKTKSISIKNFYMKRVLRIWPLYFLMVIIGTLILPFCFDLFNIDYEMPYTFEQVWYYFLFFLPSLVTFFFGHHLLEPLWSIGVEEIFYLIWAPLFKFLKKYILCILFIIISVKIALYLCIENNIITDDLIIHLIRTLRFEAMSIGGLGAYFIFNRRKNISDLYIYKRPIQFIIYSVLLIFFLFNHNIDNTIWNSIFRIPIISSLIVNFLFLYLIIGVSMIDQSIIKLENKIFSYLGEISYGIYMYHMISIFTVILFLKNILISLNPILSATIFYILVTIVVIIISAISKRYFEDPFLRIKKKYEKQF